MKGTGEGAKGRQSMSEKKISFPGKNSPAVNTPKKDNSVLAKKKQPTPANKGMQEFKGISGQAKKGRDRDKDEDDLDIEEGADDVDDLDLEDEGKVKEEDLEDKNEEEEAVEEEKPNTNVHRHTDIDRRMFTDDSRQREIELKNREESVRERLRIEREIWKLERKALKIEREKLKLERELLEREKAEFRKSTQLTLEDRRVTKRDFRMDDFMDDRKHLRTESPIEPLSRSFLDFNRESFSERFDRPESGHETVDRPPLHMGAHNRGIPRLVAQLSGDPVHGTRPEVRDFTVPLSEAIFVFAALFGFIFTVEERRGRDELACLQNDF